MVEDGGSTGDTEQVAVNSTQTKETETEIATTTSRTNGKKDQVNLANQQEGNGFIDVEALGRDNADDAIVTADNMSPNKEQTTPAPRKHVI